MTRWAEGVHGPGIWADMVANLQKILSSKPSRRRHLWEFLNLSDVRCACVWGTGTSRSVAAAPVTEHEAGCWWPALISTSIEWVTIDCRPALCKPLLEGQCRDPWMTHVSRIVVLQGIVANPAPNPPPPPPAAFAHPSFFSSRSASSTYSSGSSWPGVVWDGTSEPSMSSGPPPVSSPTSSSSGPPSTSNEDFRRDWELMD